VIVPRQAQPNPHPTPNPVAVLQQRYNPQKHMEVLTALFLLDFDVNQICRQLNRYDLKSAEAMWKRSCKR
jgi:hypothetical protein